MVSMRRVFSPALLTATACNWCLPVVALGITDLFDVSFDSNIAGNCAIYGETRLNQYVSDAIVLATAGYQTLTVAANTDPFSDITAAAERALAAYFLNPQGTTLTTILARIASVRSWLNNGGRINNGQSTVTPYLFCGDSWAIRQDMSSQMYDVKGNPMTKPDGSPYQIQDNANMVAQQAQISNKIQQTAYPYYSPRLNWYYFDEKYGDDPTIGWCTGSQAQGSTLHVGTSFSFMILCPISFTGVGVRQVTAAPIAASDFVNAKPPAGVTAQRITAVNPEVATFYHEVYHLVLGPLMNPTAGEEYSVRKMLGAVPRSGQPWTGDQALANPETYTVMSIAFDYTYNALQVNNWPVEFYTGWCTVPTLA